jgi:hypothetical protein
VLNANELLEEILILLRPQLERQQIELRTELLPDLPSPAIPCSYSKLSLISS